MRPIETVSSFKSHGGQQLVCRHHSDVCQTDMTFALYLPHQVEVGAKVPLIVYLSGLTCTHANVMEKGEFRRQCAELGLAFLAPDTSPRGEGVADDGEGAYDFGLGAGFYVDATEAPFDRHYQMYSYLSELTERVGGAYPLDTQRMAIMGHSMGGHGALILALKTPGRFKSVSALAPIVAPTRVPWGQKAFQGYLGSVEAGEAYDACALIKSGHRVPDLLIDQGLADTFLDTQLQSARLEAACAEAGIPLTLRLQAGYDHSYYFISSFMTDHLNWHAARI